ncbi:MAG: NnrS family protein [Piscinibacter sp.]|nr:NnrS family protein [Piscinibacter sp.]
MDTHLSRMPPPAPAGLPLLRLGFRPFYLAAAGAAVVLIALWHAVYRGGLVLVSGIDPVPWHAHEMLFGFVAAVVVGFLLTAGQTWTGLATPRGAPLGALVLLWLAARVASVLAPYPIFFLLDLIFLPLVSAVFLDLLVRARNLRNLPVAGVLILLSLANLAFHLGTGGMLDVSPLQAVHAGVALLVLLMSIIGGRVIPAFTRNAVPAARLAGGPTREALTLAATVAGLTAWVLDLDARLAALLLGTAAASHALRWAGWSPWLTWRRPILWILHVGYAWIPLGLLLLAASRLGLVAPSAGVHALTVGAMGGLIVGMITRTARGHTGRALTASGLEVAAYAAIVAAACARVLAPLAPGTWHGPLLTLAGGLWAAAFGLYLVRFGPWLISTRVDGKDG